MTQCLSHLIALGKIDFIPLQSEFLAWVNTTSDITGSTALKGQSNIFQKLKGQNYF